MLLVDDLLLAPFSGLLWVAEKVHDTAREEMAHEADAITEQLRQLYLMLEAKQITEADFDARERELLDRLDGIQRQRELET
ncbi:MAG: gas vesicle protein GvpG [Acidobacteria bacterium]|nr:gas vesicle protein GvpG [Acidobacteriota bacterium]